ncbi:MAG TPA: glycosyltransferase family 4 protein [Pyrinomonadaceae bacterium]|jgi:glycosyltransferase involved in cell wall biosynthesis
MNTYLLVNGNFVQANGMDMPNLALADYLAERGEEVHLVTHRADAKLASRDNVTIHLAPKPANSYLLATPVLDSMGRRWAARIARRGGCVLVNGGNCRWAGVNWVHYVHAAFHSPRASGALRTLKNKYAHKTFLARERAALSEARLVITNSERTRRDVIEQLNVDAERVHTIYYGIDPERFRPPSEVEREEARAALGWPDERPVVAFIGALGDRRKGLDTLFAAWQTLCSSHEWDADLVVIGAGAELPLWKTRVAQAGLQDRIRFLGFREDVERILAACDALVAPTRYEAYGQGVHEALCCGLPALVSRDAGVAERYPAELQDLLIPDPQNADDLVERLRDWRRRATEYRKALVPLTRQLRAHTWNHMAAQIVRLVESA